MSRNTPTPVALTSAMLMQHKPAPHWRPEAFECACLASAIHRLAPACKRLAEAECNGEWRDGQRDAMHRFGMDSNGYMEALDTSITDYATRLDRRIAKLNAGLAPFGYRLVRSGDPRGATLRMAETPVNDSTTHYTIG